MNKKNLFLGLGILMAIALLLVGLPATTHAQQGDIDGNFVFINYIGQEMKLDLDDVTYIVPGTDTVPEGGQLVLQLAVGEHKYAANIPGGGGAAGEFTIPPGGFVAKAARIELTSPAVDQNGILLANPEEYVYVFDFDPFAPPVDDTPVVDTWQPAVATPGVGSLVWINYVGDELTVDLSGQLYKVAPSANDVPGRLQIEVAPGSHFYTVSVPGGSFNGEIVVVVGEVAGLNITADLPPERDDEIGKKYDFLLPVTMHLYEEDLTNRANAAASPVTQDSAPATLPATGGEINPVTVDTPTTVDGLLIKNYAGDTLIFTINNQAYSVANNEELPLSLPPGSYSYTASLPFVATTGIVDLVPGQGVALSVAINVSHDVLSVYQN